MNILKYCMAILFSGLVILASDDNLTGFEKFQKIRELNIEAQEEQADGDFKAAGKIYLKMFKLERNRQRQAAFLLKAADSFFNAKKGSDAKQHYTNLLENYSLYVPYEHVVTNLRLLAEQYVNGECTFLHLRDKAGAIKVYELIIREAPAAHISAKDRHRLGELLLLEDRPEEAIVVYQNIIKGNLHDWEAHKQLALTFAALASNSDGDGSKMRAAVREARIVLQHDPQNAAAHQLQLLIDNSQELNARRILERAQFYLLPTSKRPSAARRYFHDVITNYPDTISAQRAREYLDTVPEIVQLERQMSEQNADTKDNQPKN